VTHSIRLREPWQFITEKGDFSSSPEKSKAIRFRRKFNTPTGLTELQTVVLQLHLNSKSCLLAIHLNDNVLEPLLGGEIEDPTSVARFDVREYLLLFNVLEIVFCELEASLPPKFETYCTAQLVLGDDKPSSR